MMFLQKSVAVFLLALISITSSLPSQISEDDYKFDPDITSFPPGYQSCGCYSDNARYRQLADAAWKDEKKMTQESCVSWCDKRKYMYAGLGNGDECYCGVDLKPLSEELVPNSCNKRCSGNQSEVCGGNLALTFFSNDAYKVYTNPGPNGSNSLGCFAEGQKRILEYEVAVQGGPDVMTVAKCVSVCKAQKFAFAGVEHSDTCFCGNNLSEDAAPAALGGCSWRCTGNTSEWCGGRIYTNLYKLPVAVCSGVDAGCRDM